MRLKLELEIEFDAEEWATEHGEGYFACDAHEQVFEMVENAISEWYEGSSALKRIAVHRNGARNPLKASEVLGTDSIRELQKRVADRGKWAAEQKNLDRIIAALEDLIDEDPCLPSYRADRCRTHDWDMDDCAHRKGRELVVELKEGRSKRSSVVMMTTQDQMAITSNTLIADSLREPQSPERL